MRKEHHCCVSCFGGAIPQQRCGCLGPVVYFRGASSLSSPLPKLEVLLLSACHQPSLYMFYITCLSAQVPVVHLEPHRRLLHAVAAKLARLQLLIGGRRDRRGRGAAAAAAAAQPGNRQTDGGGEGPADRRLEGSGGCVRRCRLLPRWVASPRVAFAGFAGVQVCGFPLRYGMVHGLFVWCFFFFAV